MKYSNLTQKELDGLLIGITDLYRLYNPSAIPTDEPLEKHKIRYSFSEPDELDDILFFDEEKDKKSSKHTIRYSLGSSSGSSVNKDEEKRNLEKVFKKLQEPSKTFDYNYSSEKSKAKEEIRKARLEKENQQRDSSKYKKLDALKEIDSKTAEARNKLRESRKEDYTIFDSIGLFVNNILGKKRLKNVDYNADIKLAPTFSELLVNYIEEKGLNNADVYKAAQIDRRHFSKIISNTLYKPTRDTVISFIIALKLNLEEANDLMATAGYAFSKSSLRDVVLEFFIRTQNYDINEINEVLYSFKLDLFTY